MPSQEISVHDLLANASLASVGTLALSAERRASEELSGEEIHPLYSLEFAVRDDNEGFRVSLDVHIETSLGDIRSKVGAEYFLESLSLDEVPIQAVEDFVNSVAIMTIIPFVRQSIADITQRVFDSPLVMPIIPRGELEFSLERD